jgi:flagellar basal body-associated protein FliL
MQTEQKESIWIFIGAFVFTCFAVYGLGVFVFFLLSIPDNFDQYITDKVDNAASEKMMEYEIAHQQFFIDSVAIKTK